VLHLVLSRSEQKLETRKDTSNIVPQKCVTEIKLLVFLEQRVKTFRRFRASSNLFCVLLRVMPLLKEKIVSVRNIEADTLKKKRESQADSFHRSYSERKLLVSLDEAKSRRKTLNKTHSTGSFGAFLKFKKKEERESRDYKKSRQFRRDIRRRQKEFEKYL